LRSGMICVYPMIGLLMIFLIFPVGESGSGVEIEGRTGISKGLPQETDSFSTVEVFDSDGDGQDEMFLGGSGFRDGSIRTEGIRSYEYDADAEEWESFGSGLPGEGSGLYYGAIGLGDLNDDGEMDIAAPIPSRWYEMDYSLNGIEIFTGDGNGGFDFLHKIVLDDTQFGSSNEAEIIDLDDDGYGDIVASTYTGVKVWFGDGSGDTWEESSPTHLKNTEISGVGIGDLDGDGLLDIVGTPYQRSEDIEMYIQGSLRSWRDVTFKQTSAGFGTKILDVDLDGNNDVIYGTNNEGIKVWLGQGEVSVTSFPCTEASSGLPDSDGQWDQIEFSDVNGDDLPDMVAACNTRETVHLFLNDLPSGWIEVFLEEEELHVGGDAYGANFGDWDGNGQIDCAACSWDDGIDAWLINTVIQGENSPPIANAGIDGIAYLGDAVTLDGSSSRDPDGEITEWEWSCTSHTDLVLEDDDGPEPSFAPDSEGEYHFTLRVMDDEGDWSGMDEVKITVMDPDINYPPTADAGQSISSTVGDRVTLDGSLSIDSDGEIMTYIWECTSHSIVLDGADSAYPSFVPDEEGDFHFTLVVEDDDGARSDEETVTVHVTSGAAPGDDDEEPIDMGSDDSGNEQVLLYGIGIGVAVVIVVAVLFFILKSRNPEDPLPVGAVEIQTETCSVCGSIGTYNGDFNRYFCGNCRRWM